MRGAAVSRRISIITRDPSILRSFETRSYRSAPQDEEFWQRGSAAEEDVFGFVDLGGDVVRAAAVGMILHHQAPVRGADFVFGRAFVQAEDFQRLLARHAGAGR